MLFLDIRDVSPIGRVDVLMLPDGTHIAIDNAEDGQIVCKA